MTSCLTSSLNCNLNKIPSHAMCIFKNETNIFVLNLHMPSIMHITNMANQVSTIYIYVFKMRMSYHL